MWAVPGSQPIQPRLWRILGHLLAHREAWEAASLIKLGRAQVCQDVVLIHLDGISANLVCSTKSCRLEEPVSCQHINALNAPSYSESFSCYIFQVDSWYSWIFMDSGYTNDAYAFWNALAVSLAGLFSVCLGSIIGPPSRCSDGKLFCCTSHKALWLAAISKYTNWLHHSDFVSTTADFQVSDFLIGRYNSAPFLHRTTMEQAGRASTMLHRPTGRSSLAPTDLLHAFHRVPRTADARGFKKACCVERFLKKHCGMPFVAFALQVLQDLASLSLGRISLHFLPFLCFSKFRWTKATSWHSWWVRLGLGLPWTFCSLHSGIQYEVGVWRSFRSVVGCLDAREPKEKDAQPSEVSLTMLETCRYFCWLEGKMLGYIRSFLQKNCAFHELTVCWLLLVWQDVTCCCPTGQATSMLLGVAALAGNLGPALVGILDPGPNIRDRIHLCGSRIFLPREFFRRRWKGDWIPFALDLLSCSSFCSSELLGISRHSVSGWTFCHAITFPFSYWYCAYPKTQSQISRCICKYLYHNDIFFSIATLGRLSLDSQWDHIGPCLRGLGVGSGHHALCPCVILALGPLLDGPLSFLNDL